MIITITQTASNVNQSYDIEGENLYFHGNTGRISRLQTITLSNKDTVIKGIYNLSKWVNYIPFRYLFGEANVTRFFNLYHHNDMYGCIAFSHHGFFKSYYVIALDTGEIFHCYRYAKDSFDYVSIYKGEKQIALIETYLNVNDCKYTHKLYILDDYNGFADTLSLFALYYASYHFAKRFHMSKGSVSVKVWSFSKYNHKYDPAWRETNFPGENFFGKISLFQ